MSKNSIFYLAGIITAFLLLAACSSADKTAKEEEKKPEEIVKETPAEAPLREVALDVGEVNAWLDLMPGPDEPKFHVSGRISVKDSSSYNLKEMELVNVKIYQNNKMIYYINPTTRVEGEQEKQFDLIFSTLTGLSPVPTFSSDVPVNVELIFQGNNKKYSYFINGVMVEKVY